VLNDDLQELYSGGCMGSMAGGRARETRHRAARAKFPRASSTPFLCALSGLGRSDSLPTAFSRNCGGDLRPPLPGVVSHGARPRRRKPHEHPTRTTRRASSESR